MTGVSSCTQKEGSPQLNLAVAGSTNGMALQLAQKNQRGGDGEPPLEYGVVAGTESGAEPLIYGVSARRCASCFRFLDDGLGLTFNLLNY